MDTRLKYLAMVFINTERAFMMHLVLLIWSNAIWYLFNTNCHILSNIVMETVLSLRSFMFSQKAKSIP